MGLLSPSSGSVPSTTQVPTMTNYISFYDFTSQWMPDKHDELASIYGNQSITGMLTKMAAESSFNNDKYIWAEKGRLHTKYTDVARTGNNFTKVGHSFRKGEVVHLSGGGVKRIGIITAVPSADTFTAQPYKQAGWGTLPTTAITAFIAGSEFRKGTGGMEGTITTNFTILENSPIILKDKFEVNGSDHTQIGWIKTDAGGYLWFLQDEYDTRRRYEDRLELMQLVAEKAESGSGAATSGFKGTEGLFQAVRERGQGFQGIADTIQDFDDILKRFDTQGKLKDYMFYVDRDQSLAIDNMLGELNAGYDGGISYGIFQNGKEQALDLGFQGFRRGTYNFYKTDYSLFNDPQLLGGVGNADGKIHGIMIPMGTQEVYEGGETGDKARMPFLHCKYREGRKYETWVTGSVGGVRTDDEDVMRVNHRSERMLCTVGANNFMLFEGQE